MTKMLVKWNFNDKNSFMELICNFLLLKIWIEVQKKLHISQNQKVSQVIMYEYIKSEI